MASAGVFQIREQPPGALPGEGALFTWSADKKQTLDTAVHGGAYAAPRGAWEQNGDLRKVRTDYTGAKKPSFQILGAVHKPFTWTGEWVDKFNSPGYAVAEKRRFEEMCRRGNPVQITFQQESFTGYIGPWTFHYFHKAKIGYTFTFDPSSRDGEGDMGRSPVTAEQPDRAMDDIDVLAAATAKAHSKKPAWATQTSVIGNVSSALASVSKRMNDLSNALSTSQGVLKPISDAKNLAMQFRALQGDATKVVLQLVSARSDIDMGVRTAGSVLDFEAWSRNTANLMRLVAGRSRKAANAMDSRDIPAAMATYRPFRGEHIYAVARKAYGTPNAWQVIFKANHLTSTVFQGTETLVIPRTGAT